MHRVFDSLKTQTYKNFEVIIIDQNEDDYVKRLYEEYKDKFIIKYIHSDEKGLSKARNKGLKYVDGDIIAFPDDDCEYKYNFLYDILDTFKNNENLNMNQMHFVKLIIDYVVANGFIEDNRILQEDPFRTVGSIATLFKDNMDDARKIIKIINDIKVNAEVV